MTFTFDPPRSLLYFALFVVVASMAVLVLGRRHPARKVLSLAVAAALAVALLTRFHRIGESSVTVADTGIVANIDGTPRIPWPDIQKAVYLADVSASEYRPGRPENLFTALGNLNARYGWYRLANGRRGLVAVQDAHGAAVVISTADAIYLLGPHDARGLGQAIASHVSAFDWGAAR
jgi:hypothetical protein